MVTFVQVVTSGHLWSPEVGLLCEVLQVQEVGDEVSPHQDVLAVVAAAHAPGLATKIGELCLLNFYALLAA